MSVVETVHRSLLRDVAYQRLRAAIVDGTLAPGAALRPDDLAARLGLSKAPVRDAIARLTADGLIEAKPQSWTRVTAVDPDEAAGAAAVVRAMHDLAVRAAVPRLDPGRVAAMRAANTRFAAAVAAGDVDAATAADDDLHGVLLTAAGNAAAVATVERWTPAVRRAERQLFGSPLGERSVRLHDELIAACAARDTEAAAAVNHTIWSFLAGTHT